MKKNVQNAFSLMEMMVVLLIVSIIAAATAPMVTKKMARSVGSGDSPWVFTGLNNNISYNMGGANASAIIGASNYSYGDNQPKYPRLVLAAGDSDHPSLVFAKSNGAFGGQINMDADNKIVTMNDQTVGKNSVAFGFDQTITNAPEGMVVIGQNINAQSEGTVAVGRNISASGGSSVAVGSSTTSTAAGAVAIGRSAKAKAKNAISIGSSAGTATTDGKETGSKSISIGTLTIAAGSSSIAIGDQAQATGTNSVAIGPCYKQGKWAAANDEYSVAIGAGAKAKSKNSIAIGAGASVSADNSIAIGAGTSVSEKNQIVLGTRDDIVYIPGRLVVGRTAVLGYSSGADKDSSSVAVIRSNRDGKMEILQRDGDGDWDAVFATSKRVDYSWAGATLYTTSDRRLKNVGEKYTAGLDELKKLDFYHYTFKADKDNTPLVGVIAQDLQKVFPDAVTKGDDGYLRIRLEDMFYAVINAVKELDTKISEIVTNITDIKATIQSQQDIIDGLKKQNSELQKQNEELQEEIKNIEKRIKKLER